MLNDKPCCAHPQNHTVSSGIKGQGRFFDNVFGGRCTRGQKSSPNPFDHRVIGDIVCPNNNHSFTASQTNPVCCHCHSLGRTCTCGIGLGVRSASANVLGKLRVAHRQNLKQEPTVKIAFAIIAVVSNVTCKLIEPGESGGKNHTGAIPHLFGQFPPRRYFLSAAGLVVGPHHRNPCIPKRFNPSTKCQLRRNVECAGPPGINPIFFREIKRCFHSGQSNDFLAIGYWLKGPLTRLRILVNTDHFLLNEDVLGFFIQTTNPNFSIQNFLNIVWGEHLGTARQSDRSTGTHNRGNGHQASSRCGGCIGSRRCRHRMGGSRRHWDLNLFHRTGSHDAFH